MTGRGDRTRSHERELQGSITVTGNWGSRTFNFPDAFSIYDATAA